MKKMYNFLKLVPIILLGANLNASAQVTTFNYTGSIQTYTVPNGVSYVTIDAKGAAGGDYVFGGGSVGQGAEVTGQLTVTPGQIIYVYVGGAGSSSFYYGGSPGGWNGGGNTTGNGGSGGGASDIRMGGIALANRLVVAGGGGGTGNACYYSGFERGGHGGGLTGEDGYDNFAPYPAAPGGDQAGGGSGFLGVGGDGLIFTDAGGGGGGYYGGAGGAASLCVPYYYYGTPGASGAGGGSSYTDPAVTSVVHTRGVNSGNGVVTICAPAVAGTIITDSVCVGANTTFTDPTGTSTGVAWSSSNTSIATVNATTGVVTGVNPGTVVITRACSTPCGAASTNVTIIVHPQPATIAGTFILCQGDMTTLSDSDPGGTWNSSNTSVATITSGGVVSTLVPGTSLISYTLSTGCKTTSPLFVNPAPPAITGSASTCVGSGTAFSDGILGGVWSVTTPAVGTIDASTGVYTGIMAGYDTIVYTLAGCSALLPITTFDPPLPIFGTDTICTGQSTTLFEIMSGGTWSATVPSVATVDPFGNVNSVSGGYDTILYTITGCPPAQFPMVIEAIGPITGITSACIGMAITLTDTTTGGMWVSADTTVAKVSPTGIVTATSYIIGASTTISYTLPSGCLSTHPIVVNAAPGPIIGADSVCTGASTTMSDTTLGGTWSSTDLAIAQIGDITGIAKGISTGYVNLSYTLPSGCFAAKSFYVEPPLPGNIGLTRNPPNDTLCLGTMVTFRAHPVNGGTSPWYRWTKFGVPMTTSTLDTFVYSPIHGDVITVTMFITGGVCAAADSVRDSVTYDIDSNKSPTIWITKSIAPDTLQYLGQVITFYSFVAYGGTAPTYQWYKDNVLIPGATDDHYVAHVYGQETYHCVVTGNPPCGTSPHNATSNKITIIDRLAVGTITNKANTISLFPNPNNGTLVLSGKVSSDDVSIEVTDMLGQIVYRSKVTPQNGTLNEQINLGHNIANGSYLLRVNSGNENEVFRFVINK